MEYMCVEVIITERKHSLVLLLRVNSELGMLEIQRKTY